MRLIDATALEKEIISERNKIPETLPCASYELINTKPNRDGQLIKGGLRKALRYLNDAPTVDAVPVVRCEHCKHSRDRNDGEKQYLIDGVLICTSSDASDVCWNPVYPTHFCSYGERKEATP